MPNPTDLEIYDRSIFSYLAELGYPVLYTPVDSAMEDIAKFIDDKDHMIWASISFHRDPNIEIDYSRDNFTMSKFGDPTRVFIDDQNTRRATYVNSIPINLSYQVEIWAAKAQIVQEIAIRLMWKITMTDPVLHSPMNPNGEDARFHILDPRWQDNSDIVNESNVGKIYRHTISFSIDGRLKKVNTRVSPAISAIPIEIYEGGSLNDYQEFICTGSETPNLCENCKWYYGNSENDRG